MKTKLLFLLFIFLSYTLQAQVTIGSIDPPNSGSLLDLKEYPTGANNVNSYRGLLLPRVLLNTANDLAPTVLSATPL